MKVKQKVDTVINSFLILIGLMVIVLGILNYNDVKTVFMIVMISYAILNLVQFILTKNSKDYEGLFTFLASLVVALIDNFFYYKSPNVLSILVMSWVTMMAIIKFIKTDYYNDRKDKMYKLRLVTLGLFIVVGIITSLSFNYGANIQIMVLGYFFLIHGILELIDPITKYLISK